MKTGKQEQTVRHHRLQARRWISGCLIMAMLLMTAACGASQTQQTPAPGGETAVEQSGGQAETGTTDSGDAEPAANAVDEPKTVAAANIGEVTRPMLFTADDQQPVAVNVTASVPAYQSKPDGSDIVNKDLFYLNDKALKQLSEDGFIITGISGNEFFEIYEGNRYMYAPNFITVDSLMHTYHLYFAHLLRQTERNELSGLLMSLTDRMIAGTEKQMDEMKPIYQSGTHQDLVVEGALRNLTFFSVAKALLDPSYDVASSKYMTEASVEIANKELEYINAAEAIEYSPLFSDAEVMEDYSQYKPRGYYDLDETLSRYFRAMMWYGRMNFFQNRENLDMSAMLMTLALDQDAWDEWGSIYAVTSFFAGASDDNGLCEYKPVIETAYGKDSGQITMEMVLTDENAFQTYHQMTKNLPAPAISSIPAWDDDKPETDKENENKGFRFMGQRFSIDASIFQKVIYDQVGENSKGDKRMLPDALDIPAALGSEEAQKILDTELKATDYEGYSEKLEEAKKSVENAPASIWTASLYAGWLDTLRPLLEKKGEGYPMFMQSVNWARKSLECFLGSYTELKHDTVLYSKQNMAEMGGDDPDELDDRGYVEPEPEVYARFVKLADGTAAGLKRFGLLSSDAESDLKKLSDLASSLLTISEKELRNELPTDEEFELIRIYGGEIEHFWHEAYKEDADGDYISSEEFPAPVVVDVATDPNGSVLELATGRPDDILVVVPVDGTLRIARGSVFSFYQFEQPLSDRLTDHEWRVKLCLEPDDNGVYHWEDNEIPDRPVWTTSYRISDYYMY